MKSKSTWIKHVILVYIKSNVIIRGAQCKKQKLFDNQTVFSSWLGKK
jgi:hypothetical protein